MADGRTGGKARVRNGIILALSVLGHVGVLALIGINAPGMRERDRYEEPPVEVFLFQPEDRPPPTRDVPSPSPASGAPRARLSPLQPRQVSPLAPPAQIAPLPLPPVPAPPAKVPYDGVKGSGSGKSFSKPVGGEEAGKVLRRSTGCASAAFLGLNKQEQEDCYERMGRGAKDAKPIGYAMDGRKRQAFDRTAAKQRADREWRENPTMPTGTSGGGDGRPAGLGDPTPTVIGGN